ncbi:hypothetical protein SAMN05192553_102397 [Cyclobacterium xiamenense]|uniref:Uncharacterized protein n=1 Tax=Cyclobacterium xiamenense TaxID=1297121 RepID=A0A1H6W3P0_9BACT|nr:hypothetical protein [Cyclobacterium xiamenense]SEJ10446.1 hypothetical protein SAMN05192553_102397 [Cyclobacterium xiamenense]
MSFESGFGLLGNYLSRQDFIYEFENNSELEYRYASDPVRQFTISHLRLGLGTNYLLARRWKLFLRSQYWLPVARTGLLEDRTHGVEAGVGVNFMLRKRINPLPPGNCKECPSELNSYPQWLIQGELSGASFFGCSRFNGALMNTRA